MHMEMKNSLPKIKKINTIVISVFALLCLAGFATYLSTHTARFFPLSIQEGQVFSARRGEKFVLAGSGDTFSVTGFHEDTTCSLSDENCLSTSIQKVVYVIDTIDASGTQKTYTNNANTKSMPYVVTIMESDFRTYAKISLKKSLLPLY